MASASLLGAAALVAGVVAFHSAQEDGKDEVSTSSALRQPVREVAQPDAASAAVGRGLAWLAAAQEEDGCWEPEKWGGQPAYRVGLTGLALLAISAADPAATGDAAKRGARFLLGSQGEDGLFGERFRGALYNHAIATLSLLKLPAAIREEHRESIDRGVRFLLEMQTQRGGWGYLGEDDFPAQESISIWSLEALVTARSLGWPNLSGTIAKGFSWFEESEVAVGDSERVSGLPVRAPFANTLSSDGMFAAWAAILGDAPEAPSARRHRALDRVAKTIASRKTPSSLYEAYFLAQVTSAAGHPVLRAHHAETRRALTASQVDRGFLAGSWDPGDRWSPAGGRLYSTLLATLTLEADRKISRAAALEVEVRRG